MKSAYLGSLVIVPLLVLLTIYWGEAPKESKVDLLLSYSGEFSGLGAVKNRSLHSSKNPFRRAQVKGMAFHAKIGPVESAAAWQSGEYYQTSALYQPIRPALFLDEVMTAAYSRHRSSSGLPMNNAGPTFLYSSKLDSSILNRAGGIIADEQGTIFGGRVTRASATPQRARSSTKKVATKTATARNISAKETTPVAQSAPTAVPAPDKTPETSSEKTNDGAFIRRTLEDGRIEVLQDDDHIAIVTDAADGTIVILDGALAATNWERLLGELFLFTSLPDLAGKYVGDGFRIGKLPDDSFLRVAGLQSGDVLTVIDGVPIEYITSENIGASIISSRVGISILREGQQRAVLLVRKVVRAGKESIDGVEMMKRFKIGEHVTWNSEAGEVSGTIIAIHTKDFEYKGYTHRASDKEPQYEIKSDKTDHIAAHKGSALNLTK